MDETRVRRLLTDKLIPAAKLGHDWRLLIPGVVVPTNRDDRGPTVHVAMSDFYASLERRTGNRHSRAAVRIPLKRHLLPYFAYVDGDRDDPRYLADIKGAFVGGFVDAMREEREMLAALAEVLHAIGAARGGGRTLQSVELVRDVVLTELDEDHWELLLRSGQRGGRDRLADAALDGRGRISLSTRGLSDAQINECLKLLRRVVLHVNEEAGLTIRDPTRNEMVKVGAPTRHWAKPDHLQAMFDAAGELDADPCRGYPQGRLHALIVLALTGLRITEFCTRLWSHLVRPSSSDPVIVVDDAKTDAGSRRVYLHRMVDDALAARYELLGRPPRDTPIFASERGTVRDPGNVRKRMFAEVATRADELLAERGHEPLPRGTHGQLRLTPHGLRRTYLTYLAMAGRSEAFAMHQAGHAGAKITLEIYQQEFGRIDPRVPAWLADAPPAD